MSGRDPQYLCSLCSTMPLQYVYTTDANRTEKEDHMLKTIAYCMAKVSIRHLFIRCD